MNTNYVDARTPEERERDAKIEVVTTYSDSTSEILTVKANGVEVYSHTNSDVEEVVEEIWRIGNCLTKSKTEKRQELADVVTSQRALGHREGVEREKARTAQIIDECGHQQEDDTIWCNMDELLKALNEGDKTPEKV